MRLQGPGQVVLCGDYCHARLRSVASTRGLANPHVHLRGVRSSLGHFAVIHVTKRGTCRFTHFAVIHVAKRGTCRFTHLAVKHVCVEEGSSKTRVVVLGCLS